MDRGDVSGFDDQKSYGIPSNCNYIVIVKSAKIRTSAASVFHQIAIFSIQKPIFAPMNSQIDFIQKISESVAKDTFVRLTLSKNADRSSSLKKVLIKLAMIKKELQYSFVFRHETQDITKNFSLKNGEAELGN